MEHWNYDKGYPPTFQSAVIQVMRILKRAWFYTSLHRLQGKVGCIEGARGSRRICKIAKHLIILYNNNIIILGGSRPSDPLGGCINPPENSVKLAPGLNISVKLPPGLKSSEKYPNPNREKVVL